MSKLIGCVGHDCDDCKKQQGVIESLRHQLDLTKDKLSHRGAELTGAFHQCESLRHQLADEKLCHEETRERLNEVATDWQVLRQRIAELESCIKSHGIPVKTATGGQSRYVMGNYHASCYIYKERTESELIKESITRTPAETLQADGWKDASGTGELWWKKPTLLDAHASMVEREDVPACNPHPDAPHGFDRNASHSAGRYVCECEGWTPDEQRT